MFIEVLIIFSGVDYITNQRTSGSVSTVVNMSDLLSAPLASLLQSVLSSSILAWCLCRK